MQYSYNARNPGVKRLLREAKELHEATEEYYAQPLEDNLFEWHFTFRGPVDSDFEEGVYHGRIVLPSEYPLKPPNILFMTQNGRFETNKKICLSISTHHPESWRPSWSIRTALLAMIGFMPSKGRGNLASLDYTPEERKILAKKSCKFECPTCGPVMSLLKERICKKAVELSKEAKEISKEMAITEKPLNGEEKQEENSTESIPPVKSTPKTTESTTLKTTEPTSTDPQSTPESNATVPSSDVTKTDTNTKVNSTNTPTTSSSLSNPTSVNAATNNSGTYNITAHQTTPDNYTARYIAGSQTLRSSVRFIHSGMLYICILVFAFLLCRRFYSVADEEFNLGDDL